MISTPLFENDLVRFTYIDLEKDPQDESLWSYNLDYVRAVRPSQTPRLIWPQGIKTLREKQIKEAEDKRDRVYFAMRSRQDDQLIGFFQMPYLAITNHVSQLEFLFGNNEWEMIYGDASMSLGLLYAFDELNLHRVNIQMPEYAETSIRRAERFGFSLEVRQREAIYAKGRYWDRLRFGLIEREWRNINKEQE